MQQSGGAGQGRASGVWGYVLQLCHLPVCPYSWATHTPRSCVTVLPSCLPACLAEWLCRLPADGCVTFLLMLCRLPACLPALQNGSGAFLPLLPSLVGSPACAALGMAPASTGTGVLSCLTSKEWVVRGAAGDWLKAVTLLYGPMMQVGCAAVWAHYAGGVGCCMGP